MSGEQRSIAELIKHLRTENRDLELLELATESADKLEALSKVITEFVEWLDYEGETRADGHLWALLNAHGLTDWNPKQPA